MTENKEDQRGRGDRGMANRNSHTSPSPSCSTVSEAGPENPRVVWTWQKHQSYHNWAKLDLVGLCSTTLSGGKIHRQSLAVTTNCCYFPSANRSAGRQPASPTESHLLSYFATIIPLGSPVCRWCFSPSLLSAHIHPLVVRVGI